tara:strand:- start:1203 stop:1538 length:336 start_codon:yes stop_codon:yes gene_type:complete
MDNNFFSITWAINVGKESARLIRSIRSGGYKTARQYYSFYSNGRWADASARRALASVKKLGNPSPYYIVESGDGSRMIYALNAMDSLSKGSVVYYFMTRVGPRKCVNCNTN